MINNRVFKHYELKTNSINHYTSKSLGLQENEGRIVLFTGLWWVEDQLLSLLLFYFLPFLLAHLIHISNHYFHKENALNKDTLKQIWVSYKDLFFFSMKSSKNLHKHWNLQHATAWSVFSNMLRVLSSSSAISSFNKQCACLPWECNLLLLLEISVL